MTLSSFVNKLNAYADLKADMGQWQAYNPCSSGVYYELTKTWNPKTKAYQISKCEPSNPRNSTLWAHAITGYGYLNEPQNLVRFKHFLLLFPSLLCHPFGFLGVLFCDGVCIINHMCHCIYRLGMMATRYCQKTGLLMLDSMLEFADNHLPGPSMQTVSLGALNKPSPEDKSFMRSANSMQRNKTVNIYAYLRSHLEQRLGSDHDTSHHNQCLVESSQMLAKQCLITMARPLALAGLCISNLIGLIAPYQGRHVYASIERNVYFGPVWAPCFQPVSNKSGMKNSPIDIRDTEISPDKIKEINHFFGFNVGGGYKI